MAKLKLNKGTFYIIYIASALRFLVAICNIHTWRHYKKKLITVFLDSWLSFEALLLHTVVSMFCDSFSSFFSSHLMRDGAQRVPDPSTHTLFVVSYFHVIERYYSIAAQQ